ncbi:hypothetical protein [Chamaesiphon sp. OTE_8_metabat_110]|uniref:hypothetical protein n=1 Tax=Chamaesiphon sp. OTE_8_metabat_110 TaxID=2964696 RepID=UPI00286B79E6|nr:hypothetical protein [Chamaesiphon sp. OTE_8_metabat_110]
MNAPIDSERSTEKVYAEFAMGIDRYNLIETSPAESLPARSSSIDSLFILPSAPQAEVRNY